MDRVCLSLIAGALLLPAPVAFARHEGHGGASAAPAPASGCAALPPELGAWTGARARIKAAPSAAKAASASLPLGQPVEASLLPAAKLVFAARPGKASDAKSRGGVFRLDIAEAGPYRVALGAGSWIDVIRDGEALASVGHGHGPACSGIRKMVDFEMKPGSYIVQISGSDEAALALMAVRLR